MAEIKTDEMHLECRIKIKWQRFDALLITHTAWLHLNGPFEIQHRNDLHSCVSSEPLIED